MFIFCNIFLLFNCKIFFLVPTESRLVGSIADYDPLNGNWGTSAASKNAEKIGKV